MGKPVKKAKEILNPEWLAKTAQLAMKRGTAIVFSAEGLVYGILPKGGGSVNVHYEADPEWVDAVLKRFPKGAVFPFGNTFGGSSTAKALRAYANIRLPEDGTGTAWIDDITGTVHVKGKGAAIHSATIEESDMPPPYAPGDIPALSFNSEVSKDIGKLIMEFTRRDDNRPFLKRVYGYGHDVDGPLYIGATDARSAILHQVSEVPEGFSFDPTLVNMFDIVGYRNDTTETGSVMHTFRLADGTTFIEKLSGITPLKLIDMFSGIEERSRDVLLESTALQKLVEDVSALGLGVNDSFGGVLVFTPAGVEMFSGKESVAEFEAFPRMPDGGEVRFALPLLSRFVKLAGDLEVTTEIATIAYVANGSTKMIAQPMSAPPAANSGATA